MSDIALVRATNEDSFAVLPDLGLFMVADGMGGAAAVDAVRDAFERGDVTTPLLGAQRNPEPDTQLMNDAVVRAYTHVAGISTRDVTMAGMGTTFVGLLVVDDRLLPTWVTAAFIASEIDTYSASPRTTFCSTNSSRWGRGSARKSTFLRVET